MFCCSRIFLGIDRFSREARVGGASPTAVTRVGAGMVGVETSIPPAKEADGVVFIKTASS
jgi:hypothetical protein